MQSMIQVRPQDRRSAYLVMSCVVLAAAILGGALLFSGCAARVPAAGGQLGRQGTPLEQALAYNATLAAANNTLAQVVIDATSGPQPLIDVPTANRILTAQSHVADADRQLTPLLADAESVGKNSAQIEKLLDDIKAAAAPLVNSRDLAIKDASVQRKVIDTIGRVYTLADQVVAALAAGGLLK